MGSKIYDLKEVVLLAPAKPPDDNGKDALWWWSPSREE